MIFSILFAAFLVPGCGGQLASPGTTSSAPSGTGGAERSGSNLAAGGILATNRSSSAGGTALVATTGGSTGIGSSRAAGGTMAINGNSSTGGTTTAGGGSATGGTLSFECNTSSAGWTFCDTGSSASNGGTTSSGDNSCTVPIRNTYVFGSNYAGYAFAFISLSQTYGDNLSCAVGETSGLCVVAQLAALTSQDGQYVPLAAIGLNLNQTNALASPANPLSRKVNSVTLSFEASQIPWVSQWLRVQINQGTTYYCYYLSDSDASGTVTIAADAFYTQCWRPDLPNKAWDGMGATGIQLIAVNIGNMPLNVNVCLDSVTLN